MEIVLVFSSSPYEPAGAGRLFWWESITIHRINKDFSPIRAFRDQFNGSAQR
jgi:hypothetical protein